MTRLSDPPTTRPFPSGELALCIGGPWDGKLCPMDYPIMYALKDTTVPYKPFICLSDRTYERVTYVLSVLRTSTGQVYIYHLHEVDPIMELVQHYMRKNSK